MTLISRVFASCFHCRGGSGGGLALSGCTHGKKVDFFEELLLVVLEFSDHGCFGGGRDAHVAEVWECGQ